MPYNLTSLNTLFSHGTQAALELLFPPQCSCCTLAIASSRHLFCDACLEGLAPHALISCNSCGKIKSESAPEGSEISTCPCQHEHWRYRGVAPLGKYEGALRQAVLRMKLRGSDALAWSLGKLLLKRQAERIRGWQPDLVVPIPGHRFWGGAHRGWAPAAMAAAIGSGLHLPSRGGLLAFQRKVKQQHTLTLSERRTNMRGSLKRANGYDITGARILLVDDVMTSGATADEASRALYAAGAQFVAVAIAART